MRLPIPSFTKAAKASNAAVAPAAREGRQTGLAPWRLTAVGVVLGMVLATVVFAPARWLSQGVAALSGDRVLLLEPLGTLWQGSARLVLGAGNGSQANTALPGRVQWKLRPSLQGVHLALNASCCLAQDWVWTLIPSFSTVELRISDLPADEPSLWPTDLLAGLGTPWNTLQLKGTLALSTQQLSLVRRNQQWQLDGQVQLDATQMSTVLSPLKPVGSYRMVLMGGPAPSIQLSTLEGSLKLSGSGSWASGHLQFDGEASAAPERAEALANLLNLIGPRDGARAIIKGG